MLKGNKGEWSELYAALRILAEGKLYIADKNGNRNSDYWLNILSLLRKEAQDRLVRYQFDPTKTDINISINDDVVCTVPANQFITFADRLKSEILKGKGTFSIGAAFDSELQNKLEFRSIKAKSDNKSDIFFDTLDPHTGIVRNSIGFSIKSEFGQAPTLFNTAKSSAAVYMLEGFTVEDMEEINQIYDEKEHVAPSERAKRIQKKIGTPVFVGYPLTPRKNFSVFKDNLELINPYLIDLWGIVLWAMFTGQIVGRKLTDILNWLERTNPLNLSRAREKYAYMLKAFLYSSYCGMTASNVWDGKSDVNGGFIRVSKSGDILAYYALESDSFKDYLFNNCFVEYPSTDKGHGYYGQVYQENGEFFFRLNFSIRYQITS